jgi:hypothetical protein
MELGVATNGGLAICPADKLVGKLIRIEKNSKVEKLKSWRR